MPRKPSLKTLRKKADKALSDYVRQRDKGICCTCHKPFPIEKVDAGHWIPRTQWGTRYDERNVHSQCQHCNRFAKPQDEYAAFMLDNYGEDIMEVLREQKHWTLTEFVSHKLLTDLEVVLTTRAAYLVIINHYKHKLEKLQ